MVAACYCFSFLSPIEQRLLSLKEKKKKIQLGSQMSTELLRSMFGLLLISPYNFECSNICSFWDCDYWFLLHFICWMKFNFEVIYDILILSFSSHCAV